MAPSVGGYGPELAAAERARQQLSVAGVLLGDATAKQDCTFAIPRDERERDAA